MRRQTPLVLVLLLLAAPVLHAGRMHGRGALIPAGRYLPLYTAAGQGAVRVASFTIDREPVTRADYERFLKARPEWRRGVIKPVFAEASYLSSWDRDDSAGAATLRQPVTEVSWFAARAYCASHGQRLPSLDEWEYVAQASNSSLVALYTNRRQRPADVGNSVPNRFGVADLHELVWEWVEDFNSILVSDDSRQLGAGGDERDRHLYCASAALGATDPSNYAAFLRYAFRSGLTGRTTARSLGFRCAIS